MLPWTLQLRSCWNALAGFASLTTPRPALAVSSRRSRFYLLCSVLVVCVMLGLGTAGTSEAASGWAIEPIPAPTLPSGELAAVSCAEGTCTAVGSFINSPGHQVTLA